ncbi:MAG: hypothetical protein WCN27_00970 [Alphaproteobacteria bacterium]
MHVTYYDHLGPYYICTESAIRKGEKSCQSVKGMGVDACCE